jgi:hypothetical protein
MDTVEKVHTLEARVRELEAAERRLNKDLTTKEAKNDRLQNSLDAALETSKAQQKLIQIQADIIARLSGTINQPTLQTDADSYASEHDRTEDHQSPQFDDNYMDINDVDFAGASAPASASAAPTSSGPTIATPDSSSAAASTPTGLTSASAPGQDLAGANQSSPSSSSQPTTEPELPWRCMIEGAVANANVVPDDVKSAVNDILQATPNFAKVRTTGCLRSRANHYDCREHRTERDVACRRCVSEGWVCVRKNKELGVAVLLPVCRTDRGDAEPTDLINDTGLVDRRLNP